MISVMRMIILWEISCLDTDEPYQTMTTTEIYGLSLIVDGETLNHTMDNKGIY